MRPHLSAGRATASADGFYASLIAHKWHELHTATGGAEKVACRVRPRPLPAVLLS